MNKLFFISYDAATAISTLAGFVVGGLVFMCLCFLTESQWRDIITTKSHRHDWVHRSADVVGVGKVVNLTNLPTTKLVQLRYKDYYGNFTSIYFVAPLRFPKKDLIAVSKEGDIYVYNKDKDNLNTQRDPFKAYKDKYFPVFSTLVSVIVGMILGSITGAALFYNVFKEGGYFTIFVRAPSLYGMKLIPPPPEVVWVHTAEGKLIPKEI